MDQQNKRALTLSVGLLFVVLFKFKPIVEYLKSWIPDRSRSDPDVYSALDAYKRDLFWNLKLLRHSKESSDIDELRILEVCYNPLLAANYKYFPYYSTSTIVCEDRSLRRVSEKRSYMTIGNLDALRNLADKTFDAAVVTFVLCASKNLERDLCELRRVLIDGGHLYFLEHEPLPEGQPLRSETSYNPLPRVASSIAAIFRTKPYSIAETIRNQRFLRCEVIQRVLLPQYYPDREFVLGFAIK
ncbi:methyltransferase-like protein 7B [Galendromus occidentalis]|uniref:Methyltransferase-like protein 7B n=1 Tax=Galendromus occidentalis TaxID=34638 RepID=A0AAJ6QNI4_9ACAR|nr:methyltransferase-like protein 7B [Galendromus occidentalis]